METARPKATQAVDRHVGSNIAALRKAKGLSQGALASACGVSFQQLQKYETGKNRVGAARLQAIATHLEVPVALLFSEPSAKDGQGVSLSMLRDPQAGELLRTFNGITDPAARRETLALVRTVARACGGTSA